MKPFDYWLITVWSGIIIGYLHFVIKNRIGIEFGIVKISKIVHLIWLIPLLLVYRIWG